MVYDDHYAPLIPQRTVFAVGDIHGCIDKLDKLLTLIDADIEQSGGQDPILVCVGDYVDRGDRSDAVLRTLRDLSHNLPASVVCLCGNHERMLLDFLHDTRTAGDRWLRNGGWATVHSFGIPVPEDAQSSYTAGDYQNLANALQDAMGDDLIGWLNTLPLRWSSGNLWAVHAGADPSLPMAAQETHTLLWGTKTFHKFNRGDGQWVVHGHVPVKTPTFKNGRIAVDTGAVYGGALTAARIDTDGFVRFLSA